MSHPWWKDKKLPAIGTNYFSIQWAIQALIQDAIQFNGTVYTNALYGASLNGLEDAKKALTDLGGRHFLTQGGGNSLSMHFAWDHGAAVVGLEEGDLSIEYASSDPEFFVKLEEACKKLVGPRISAGRVYVLVMTAEEGPQFQSIGVAATNLERSNYEPKVLDDFDHVVADLQTSNPCGRLVVLDGVPGTGKTFLIRALVQAVPKALFVIVPANLVPQLANPSMINALMQTRSAKDDKEEIPTVFLVEDADDCLTARAADNVNSVSALLNLGDGILGQMFDIRIICTTNAHVDDLDEAVTRPGRLCRYIHVDALTPETSNAVYKRLTGQEGSLGKATLAEVYRIARDGGWQPEPKKHVMGFQTQASNKSAVPGRPYQTVLARKPGGGWKKIGGGRR